MNGTLYGKVVELVNQYNAMLVEYGVKITINRRSVIEEVAAHKFDFWDMLLYKMFLKKIEEKNYRYIPNHYKFLVLQITPIAETMAKKRDCKKYVFSVYQRSRSVQSDAPIKWQRKEQTVISRVKKRLEKALKQAQKATSICWCNDTLGDALRYTLSSKYNYLEDYCGRSRFFWEVLLLFAAFAPVILATLIALMLCF